MTNDETDRLLAGVDRRRLLAAAGAVGLLGAAMDPKRADALIGSDSLYDRLGGDVLQTLAEASADRFRRVMRQSAVPVVDWTSEAHADLFPPGCVAVLFAHRGSRDLEAVRQWVAAGDADRINEFAERLRRQFAARTMITLKEAAERMFTLPVYADLRYESLSLAQNLHIPGDAPADFVGLFTMPFSGGRLDDRRFSSLEYLATGPNGAGVDFLLVRRAPRMTDIVRAALDKVPEEQLGINIGDSSVCWAWTAFVLAAYAVAAAAAATKTGTCSPFYDRLDSVSLPESELSRLGPVASARKLLEMRRDALVSAAA